MKPVKDMYKGGFFKNRHKLSWRVPYVCDAICDVFKPTSVIDIGCGIGDYVQGFTEREVVSFGIEGSENCVPFLVANKAQIYIKDIRKPISVGQFDLAICLEVLEHVEEEFADAMISNLIRLSDHVLVSAAPPGQKGHYHLNCQTKEYWIYKFFDKGYQRVLDIENEIKAIWKPVQTKKEMSAYYSNLMYFQYNYD